MFVESKRGRREGCVVKMHSQLLPWIKYIDIAVSAPRVRWR